MDEESPERTDAWSTICDVARATEAVRKLERFARSPTEIEARRRALELLVPRPGEIVIDVGAGSGLIAVDLARRVAPGGRVFAIDPSGLMLDHARRLAGKAGVSHLIDCRIADGRALPFGPAAFDAALCHWVLSHVDPPQAIVTEMRRVTRRGGRVLAVEVDWGTAMVHPGEPDLTRRILNHNAGRHVDAWIGRRLAVLFREAGLADVTVEPIVSIDQGGGDRAWLEYLHERAHLAREAGAVEAGGAAAWVAALDEAFAASGFFFAFVQFAVIGRVPD